MALDHARLDVLINKIPFNWLIDRIVWCVFDRLLAHKGLLVNMFLNKRLPETLFLAPGPNPAHTGCAYRGQDWRLRPVPGGASPLYELVSLAPLSRRLGKMKENPRAPRFSPPEVSTPQGTVIHFNELLRRRWPLRGAFCGRAGPNFSEFLVSVLQPFCRFCLFFSISLCLYLCFLSS